MNLKRQDVLVLLKIVAAKREEALMQLDLATSLALSPAEVSNSLRRAAYADLFVRADRRTKRTGQLGKVRAHGLWEFVVYGVRYVFPAKLEGIAVGTPTAWAGPPLATQVVGAGDNPPVWADAEGTVRGISLTPLYETAPAAAKRDSALYALLALVDAIRVGRARERKLAAHELRARLVKP